MRFTTLDRYILRTFLSSLLLVFLVLLALRVLGDLSANMDEFAEQLEPASGQAVSFAQLLNNIYVHYSNHIFVYLSELGGIIIVTAAAFSIARMNYTNELTAMLASGVSLHRVVWPILICAILLNVVIVLDQEFVIPAVREKLIIDPDDPNKTDRYEVPMLTDGNGTVWNSILYEPREKTLYRPTVTMRDKQLRYVAHFTAATASPGEMENRKGWLAEHAILNRRAAQSDQAWRHTQSTETIYTTVSSERLVAIGRKRWEKDNGGRPFPANRYVEQVIRISDNDPHYNMTVRAESFIPAKPVRVKGPDGIIRWQTIAGKLNRPRFDFHTRTGRVLATIVALEATWVPGIEKDGHWKLQGGALFHQTELTGEEVELQQSGKFLQFSSSRELTRLLASGQVRDPNAARLAKYVRFADPLNNIVMLLLGLPFILSRERNLKASALVCVLVVALFFGLIYAARYIGLPDFWGAFLPVLIFGPISVLMLDNVKT
jgi:lipopolysaccharide export LptBFGC system permease protein LptF